MRRIREWILGIVVMGLQVGAHCGLCGKWMDRELIYRDWAWSVCRECKETGATEPTLEYAIQYLSKNPDALADCMDDIEKRISER